MKKFSIDIKQMVIVSGKSSRNRITPFWEICGLLSQIIDRKKEIEVGYRISDKFWNQGIATEAAKGCIAYASDHLKLHSLISLIRSVNQPSIRVAEKNGFRFEKETIFQGVLHRVYRLYLN